MVTRSQEKAKKKQFVEKNREVYEEAYLEERKRKKGEPYGPKFLKFIDKAREAFGYSASTYNIDIWTKFNFFEIDVGIDDREKSKHLKNEGIRKVLGYGPKTS